MKICTQLIALTLLATHFAGCSVNKEQASHKLILVVGTIVEIETTEEVLQYTLQNTKVLCNLVISVDTINASSLSEFTPVMIVIPKSLGDSLGIEEAATEMFSSGQKWSFETRMFDREDSPLEVGSVVEGVPLLLIAVRAELLEKDAD